MLGDRLFPSNAGITYAGRKDGIGAQMHGVLSLYAYAQLRSLRYIERPLRDIEHEDGLPDWDLRWNQFFNLPTEEPSLNEQPVVLRQVTRQLKLDENKLYAATKAHRFVDYFPGIYRETMPHFRRRYAASSFPKKSLFRSDSECLKVAVHLRRGDVLEQRPNRVSSLTEAKTQLDSLRESLRKTGLNHEILVFSQGSPEAFHALEGPNTRLLLDSDLFATLHSMITADVLVTARSALSYVAALYSENTVVYKKHLHPPLPGWLQSPGKVHQAFL